LTFTLDVLIRINTTAAGVSARLAAYGCMISLAVFIYMIGHVGRLLRANGALRSIGAVGREVIRTVYPRLSESPRLAPNPQEVLTTGLIQTISSRLDGTVIAFDATGLTELARRFDCLIEIVPQVGDFVAVGDPLFRIYNGGMTMPDGPLHHSIALGPERTFEQDPAFALRIIVDIAAKALSTAINDPTTAVLALDEIHHLLGTVGRRHLDDRFLADSDGNFRLAYHTPDWGDFVNLGVTEIRQYGGVSIQVARRLRALLEDLIKSLPEQRAKPLRQELELLQRSAERFFTEPEDRALAEISDPQGVGGRHQDNAAESTIGPQHLKPAAEAVHT
jgi:uncharacterized membrane protein